MEDQRNFLKRASLIAERSQVNVKPKAIEEATKEALPLQSPRNEEQQRKGEPGMSILSKSQETEAQKHRIKIRATSTAAAVQHTTDVLLSEGEAAAKPSNWRNMSASDKNHWRKRHKGGLVRD